MSCTTRNKSAAYLPPLVGLHAISDGSTTGIYWNTGAPPYPEQEVLIGVRPSGSSAYFTMLPITPRDNGSYTIDGNNLNYGVDYTVWLRPEIAEYYGEWQAVIIKNETDWSEGIEAVTHLGETLTFNAETVTSPL